ncbi:MAG: c-type cytochrome [Synechococcus sp.]
MRKLVSAVLALLVTLAAPAVSFAADAAHGAQIFSANCAACHIGGGNVVNGQRTLLQGDLEAYLTGYGDDHEQAIATQVTNGKNAMPAFGGKLSDADIADVAAYVEQQAGVGWS